MIDLRQSPAYARYMKSIGWRVEKIPQQVFIRKIPLLGSIIKIQRPQWPIKFRKVNQTAKKHKALLVKLEVSQQLNNKTMKQLNNHRFYPDRWPLLPTKTIWLDLTKTEKQLLKEMAKDARSFLRQAGEEDYSILVYCSGNNFEDFYEGFRRFGKGYIPEKKEFQALINAFGNQSLLIIAVSKHFDNSNYRTKETEILAGALFLIADKTAYYFYAFTSPKGRKNFSQYALVWRAIKEFKKRGIKILDLEGIYDPRFKFTQRWRGFSHFKKSFGGQEIIFPGSFIKYYHPLLKILHF